MKIYRTVILLVEAACLFVDCSVHTPGVQGPATICVLKGQSVDLRCSPTYPISSKTWYTVHLKNSSYVLYDFAGDRTLSRYNVSEENNFTLTISDLSWNDDNYYCCGNIIEIPGRCWFYSMKLIVADLQVKVLPTTEGQTVTLMCSTSCPLTEKPAAYIWYKNREFLYEDWSPWYQELVSSEEAVRYSCAIKGYEDLRAPEVSVETCFTVTYDGGRMCSYTQTPVDESCSITYPREVHVLRTPLSKDFVQLTCTPSCNLTDPQTAYRWYQFKVLYKYSEKKHLTVPAAAGDYSCAVKSHEDLRTAEVCGTDETCFTVNYGSSRICAVEGSSVNITAEFFQNHTPHFKFWYKIRSKGEIGEKLTGHADRLEYHHIMNVVRILTIKNLTKNDSAEYKFQLQPSRRWKTDVPGTMLVVTDLTVKITPCAVVTEGQAIRLTCSTRCPLTDDTSYIWYFNSRPLSLLEDQDRNKHLVLDPVSRQHVGSYSCAVKHIISPQKTLTVQEASMAVSNAIRLTVVLMIPIPPLFFYFWRRRTHTMGRCHFGSMMNASAL
ncbi:uncharacterized protein LOC114441983 isoform X2 [Parambassis ranga]|uniref:Uncharacterized protein LOC114441983 isoform X2 n=1 Tax=Parambassis ranga TaxID=210632 RepID=A0A6P7J388_9TELE|nr:uncharacterized protein LOC114441983 isoform X2 [Parambassis ranga]